MAAQQALSFLIGAVFGLVIALLLARFLVEATRVGFRDPIAQGLYQFTNPLLQPFRRLIPSWNGIGLAAPILALLLSLLKVLILGLIFVMPGPVAIVFLTLAAWLDALFWLLIILLIVYVIMSFVDRYGEHPISQFLGRLLRPMLAPIRRLLPPLGPLDLSVFVFSILLIFLHILLVGSLRELAGA